MRNLRFLRIFKSRVDGNDRVHIPEEMEFPRRLRLLHWEAYPSKSLPPRFHPEYLVELDMKYSKLEKLWDGIEQNGEWCDDPRVLCRRIRKGYLYPIEDLARGISRSQTKHLFIFHSDSFDKHIWLEVSKEITFKFSSKYQDFDIFECGVQILTDETFGSNNEGSGDEDGGNDHWDTHESGEASNEEEDDDDNIAEGRSVRQRRWLQI
ncbi:unnamed protein product [Arabidopsis arenosa]|uniref:Uncharacterized protein n=1 Tax=Arabidopsis arenosa TaxID=38785 RepID=A0A8S1ZLF2_ARAAE|nr:unnamed protein product [Arabidopsis arenosa]